MKSTINGLEKSKRLLSTLENDRVKFEIFEWTELNGGSSNGEAASLFYLNETKIKLKEVKITLNNGSVTLESGALYYQKGDIEIENKVGNVGKKLLQSVVSRETVFKPLYKGTGEITLEPSFGHYMLIELEDEEIIVDDGSFYACESTVEVGVSRMKNLSSAALGGEGFFQTKLKGRGIVLLEVPVPKEEIVEYKLQNETLKVDGNICILRSGNIDFTVEKATKSLIGSATSGEGFLNVYRGTGTVWILPTKLIYNQLKYGHVTSNPGGKSNTKI